MDCLSCGNTLYYLVSADGSQKQCVPNCGPGFYATAARVCANCHSSCYSCSGALITQCLSCPDGKTLFQGKCLDKCFANQYMNSTGGCIDCPEKCALCMFQDNAVKCLKCLKSLIFRYETFETQCLSNCESQAPERSKKKSNKAYDRYKKDEDTGYCIYKSFQIL